MILFNLGRDLVTPHLILLWVTAITEHGGQPPQTAGQSLVQALTCVFNPESILI
ncbi:hypothetical protein EV385_0540 [Krasilnikovia cinnamomea]|uniref:Uncharacterized protein n=1 Tax=Krasilnikovia cinnamomea TaxID=349313 RepID=A0A4Q7ZFE2_9ACTN|nr:hypothetical protein EV385_0540 [Krasilnikovia cinnamomea]